LVVHLEHLSLVNSSLVHSGDLLYVALKHLHPLFKLLVFAGQVVFEGTVSILQLVIQQFQLQVLLDLGGQEVVHFLHLLGVVPLGLVLFRLAVLLLLF